jgi:signal peptidase I
MVMMQKSRTIVRTPLSYVLLPLIPLILFLIIFSFMTVEGESMSPILHDGQKVLFSRYFYGLRLNSYWIRWRDIARDDLVVFRSVDNGKLVLKRCIGIAGDPLLCYGGRIEINSRITVDLDESMYEYFSNYNEIPEGYIFVLGENLNNSTDSRTFGFVHRDDVKGKVVYISRKQQMTAMKNTVTDNNGN